MSGHTVNNRDPSRISHAVSPITKLQDTTESWVRLHKAAHHLQKVTVSPHAQSVKQNEETQKYVPDERKRLYQVDYYLHITKESIPTKR